LSFGHAFELHLQVGSARHPVVETSTGVVVLFGPLKRGHSACASLTADITEKDSYLRFLNFIFLHYRFQTILLNSQRVTSELPKNKESRQGGRIDLPPPSTSRLA
jgi:hypothetical protein